MKEIIISRIFFCKIFKMRTLKAQKMSKFMLIDVFEKEELSGILSNEYFMNYLIVQVMQITEMKP